MREQLKKYLDKKPVRDLVEEIGDVQGINMLLKAVVVDAGINDAIGYARPLKEALMKSDELLIQLLKLIYSEELSVSCIDCGAAFPERAVVEIGIGECPHCGAKDSFKDVVNCD